MNITALVPTPAEIEDKYVTRRWLPAYSAIPGDIEYLSLIEHGYEKSQRIGRHVAYNYLTGTVFSHVTGWDWTVQMDAASCRLLIFYDRQSNGATPVFSDILDTTAASYEYYPVVPLRQDARDRFLFLYDRKWTIEQPRSGHESDIFDFKLDLSGLTSTWKDEGGWADSCMTGTLHFYYGCSKGGYVNFDMTMVLHFIDP